MPSPSETKRYSQLPPLPANEKDLTGDLTWQESESWLLFLSPKKIPNLNGVQPRAPIDFDWKSGPQLLAAFPGALLTGRALWGVCAAAPSEAARPGPRLVQAGGRGPGKLGLPPPACP